VADKTIWWNKDQRISHEAALNIKRAKVSLIYFKYLGPIWRLRCVQKYPMIKDARSVSLYPYNQSQILQNVKYTK